MGEPSKKRLQQLIRDERKASREYLSYGYADLAMDEARHRRFLQGKLRKMS